MRVSSGGPVMTRKSRRHIPVYAIAVSNSMIQACIARDLREDRVSKLFREGWILDSAYRPAGSTYEPPTGDFQRGTTTAWPSTARATVLPDDPGGLRSTAWPRTLSAIALLQAQRPLDQNNSPTSAGLLFWRGASRMYWNRIKVVLITMSTLSRAYAIC